MSLTLGEKLRQAREERGIPISEVAEQTRISSLYLQSIENDDYKSLPGGIFNKGFVKSFAKYVGIDEQEALQDYSRVLAQNEVVEEDGPKPYKPEVLTDDRSRSSMVPTAIIAIIILGLMTGGILYGVNYLRNQPATPVAANKPGSNTNSGSANTSNTGEPSGSGPDMASLKVEFKALGQPVPISAITDGAKSDKTVAAGSNALFEPKESLTVNYNKWNADKVQMTINGKAITLPVVPLNPKDKRIEFTISKENIGKIWSAGAISTEVPAATTDTNANVPAANTATPPTGTKATPVPKATVAANTTTPPKPTPTVKTNPTPRPTVITVPQANKPH